MYYAQIFYNCNICALIFYTLKNSILQRFSIYNKENYIKKDISEIFLFCSHIFWMY